MEIPYTSDARPDTGLYNSKVGIWLFLASEVMLFGGLFATYIVLRTQSLDWHPGRWFDLNIPIGTFNTAVLISSSITMVLAWANLKLNNFKMFRLFMGITILCGAIFLGVKSVEYTEKFRHHHFPSTHAFYAIYFTLTGLHGIHVLGGMIMNFYLWIPGSYMWKTQPERFINRVETSGLFWHFVDLVWIFLFPVLYLL
ncbi:MAG: heme-copper oxidase subunit III [Verrucomicrobiae bacterium]|nr:heme-copper oxidase subunit III [Verrucomicrobiae bacterium]